MRPARYHTLAIALVAVAICADRGVAAGSAGNRHPTQGITGQIVRQLQIQFRRVAATIDPVRLRQVHAAPLASVRFVVVESVQPCVPVSALHSRLPPPCC
ncbi:MAG TPA: hypothetical protein PLD59_15900 [Tepidisphaeraceae bacterium]|nr:hypothetical protein [Tepidisphaeraceae bacterium]